MITLLTYSAAFGEPSASPFCTKAIGLLQIAGVDWQREDLDDPRKMPYQKLPAIRVDGQIIADSENIRAYLESLGADFDPGLNDVQKAQSRALIRMAEDHMYFHQLLDRWDNDAVWAVLKNMYFEELPGFLRGLVSGRVRTSVLKGARAQGLGRFTAAERLARIEPDLRAIATLVGAGYLFGEEPTAADLSVAAILSGMAATPVPTALSSRVKDDTVLMEYVERVKSVWSVT